MDYNYVNRDAPHVDPKVLGSLTVFNLARLFGYGKVTYPSMPVLSLPCTLHPDKSFINFGSGIGCFLLFLVMSHPLCHFAGVEVAESCYNIAVEARHTLSWLVPNFEDCVFLFWAIS